MKRHHLVLSLILFLPSATALAQPGATDTIYQDQSIYSDDSQQDGYDASSEYDIEAPDLDYVWVDGYSLSDGTVTDGFYRRRHRSGYTWTEGYYDDWGQWIGPHWRPLRYRSNQIWVPGPPRQ